MKRLALMIAFAAPLLSSCGFTPLYATADTGGKSALASVHVADIQSSDFAARSLRQEFKWRAAAESAGARYDLYLKVKEQAQQLAVQIDDSVTRYNYRMTGSYRLVERASGAATTGRADAVVSFNVVNSQYSTLFAEKAAREKAARTLVDGLERDILANRAAEREPEAAAAPRIKSGVADGQ